MSKRSDFINQNFYIYFIEIFNQFLYISQLSINSSVLIMDYEEITESLIRKTLNKFGMEKEYQEFLDSLITFNDFKDPDFKKFQEYLNNQDI